MFESSAARGLVTAGKLKALFVGSDQPLPTWPDVPTAEKVGLPGFRSGSWFALFVPARTPAAVVNRLNVDINSALASPALTAQIAGDGLPDSRLIRQRRIDVE